MAFHDLEKVSPRTAERSPSSNSEDSIAETISIREHYDEPEKVLTPQISRVSSKPPLSRKATSIGTTGTTDPNFEIDWEDENDTMNPRNWPLWYKGLTIGFISWSTWVVYDSSILPAWPSLLILSHDCSVLYSTSYTTGLPYMMRDFNVSSEPVVTLGVTTYLLGLAVGSVILAPVSEIYGRRPVYIVSMGLFMVLVIPCGLGTSLAEVLVVRFFGALAGSAMIANAPGTVSDIVNDEYRALAFSIWSVGPLNGPVFGPVIGGFVTQYMGWRWTNWLVMILSGVAWAFVSILKETYAPALLQKKAKKMRKETEDERWWSRYDNKVDFWGTLRINLSRPFVMMFTEPIW